MKRKLVGSTSGKAGIPNMEIRFFRDNELSKQLREIDSKLAKTAKVEYKSIPIANKLISLGEIRAEYSHIEPLDDSTIVIAKNVQEKEHQLEQLEASYASIGETRVLTIETLNDFIQTYIAISKDALDEYGDYCARFDYKKAAYYPMSDTGDLKDVQDVQILQ